MLRRRSRAALTRVQVLTSNVTRIDFERPRGFEYSPGDYVFLCLPTLARHEWHPFTLSSAPEDPQRLTVHVRSVGNWTGIVRERLPAAFSAGEAAFARIDGPYGTASRHILDAPHAVAIAGGIGVTPFASILQSLLLRAESSDEPPTLRKLRFVWLNRDQYSFEWFRDLLVELERRDHQRLLDVHTFMTAGRADMAGGVFELARLVRRRRRGDLLTGLQAHTALGAPDFDRLLESFCRSPDLPHPEVFFCGPLSLERVVEQTCRRLGLRMRSERF
jgi:NADPH oxidase 5